MKNELKVFESSNIRSSYDEEQERWFFSVIDIISVLTESKNPKRYWSDLKSKLSNEEGFSQVYDKIVRLKIIAPDGKKRETDCADVETILRIIQSVPSPKAEPVKQWLAKVGYERMQEITDPSLAIDRARATYKEQGHSDKWIQQRMSGQQTRNNLTDYWSEHGIEQPKDYAILTNIIHKEWSGLSVKEHKNLKGLERENLRDHMSEAELIFTALAELSTRQVAENSEATGMSENKKAAQVGGNIAKRAKEDFEERTGQKVISNENYLPQSKKTKQIKNKE